MSKDTCSTCAHYRQHYTFDNRRIFQVYCGHCTQSVAKRKRPDTNGCEKYMPLDSCEETFVTKEYLSKALLEYMMRLELLPEIWESEERTNNGDRT